MTNRHHEYRYYAPSGVLESPEVWWTLRTHIHLGYSYAQERKTCQESPSIIDAFKINAVELAESERSRTLRRIRELTLENEVLRKTAATFPSCI